MICAWSAKLAVAHDCPTSELYHMANGSYCKQLCATAVIPVTYCRLAWASYVTVILSAISKHVELCNSWGTSQYAVHSAAQTMLLRKEDKTRDGAIDNKRGGNQTKQSERWRLVPMMVLGNCFNRIHGAWCLYETRPDKWGSFLRHACAIFPRGGNPGKELGRGGEGRGEITITQNKIFSEFFLICWHVAFASLPDTLISN